MGSVLRLVTYRGVSRQDCERAVAAFGAVVGTSAPVR
jgi:hypothetical protein